MDKYLLDKSEKDVKSIKALMDRSTEDFMQLGKIFIGWGLTFLILFIGLMAVYAFKTKLSDIITGYPAITAIPLIMTAGAAFVSYHYINKTVGLHGLTKPLLAVWLAIITYITLMPAGGYLVSLVSIAGEFHKINSEQFSLYTGSTEGIFFLPYIYLGTLLLAFTFGLLCLRIFTHLKFAGALAVVYMLLIAANYTAQFTGNKLGGGIPYTISIIGYSVIMPATFLIIGGCLEFRRTRRN